MRGLPVGVATREKCFGAEGDGGNGRDGGVVGRSATLFTAAFDRTTGVGTYVAMEPFEGSLSGRAGSFNFVHSAATTSGSDRTAEFLTTVRCRIASGSTTSCRQPDDGHGVRRPNGPSASPSPCSHAVGRYGSGLVARGNRRVVADTALDTPLPMR
ncbi:DUF3224 domain-containing protein [Streptomyces sp. WP-1]|uniref:DUF3224 domain-containing protein n=1 Tax=Streptomyces sp. WP-1 TaxID=3041497 RepID=UPI00351AC67A